MSSTDHDWDLPARRSAVHWIALALVWVTIASGSVVFSEPAPIDALTMALIFALPVLGLVRTTPLLVLFIGTWTVCGVGALLASTQSNDVADSAIHSAISIFLYAAAFIFAAFVALKPRAHSKLILNAYIWAAFIASIAGSVGYFGLVPGAAELFTKFERAAGTFKDPNVYGAFLVPAGVYALHLSLTARLRYAPVPVVIFLFVTFGVFLSFSRGAWINYALAIVIYLYFAYVLAESGAQRLKMSVLGVLATAGIASALVVATQVPAIAKLLEQRFTLTQSYDEGPEGRFGGQEKAKQLLSIYPLGIGAKEFAVSYHHEDVHNVYLSMFLNAGWLGGLTYSLMVALTVIYGLNHALKPLPARQLFWVIYASFVGLVVEGVVIDTDHWRHFYLLMGLIWGLMAGDTTSRLAAREQPPASTPAGPRTRRPAIIHPAPAHPRYR